MNAQTHNIIFTTGDETENILWIRQNIYLLDNLKFILIEITKLLFYNSSMYGNL